MITACKTPTVKSVPVAKSIDKIIGEWNGRIEKEENVSLIFDTTQHVIFIQGNDVYGGANFSIKGEKGELKYEIDYSKNPIWLDLVFYQNNKIDEVKRVKGIVRFLTDNKIEFRANFTDANRYSKFEVNNDDETIVLDKVLN